MTVKVILYTGSHCPLCQKAKTLLYPVLIEYKATLEEVNIASTESLQKAYGLRIPVVKMPDGEEKGWPFTVGQVRNLLARQT